MGTQRAGNEVYSAENLAAFVQEYLLSNDAAGAYGRVFKTRRREYNAERGAVVLARADVRGMLAQAQAARAGELFGGETQAPESGAEFGLERQMQLLRELAESPEVAAGQRITAILRYGELEGKRDRERAGADVPEELRAFLAELRSNYA